MKVVSYIKDKTFIKGLCAVLCYFLFYEVLATRVITPIVSNSVLKTITTEYSLKEFLELFKDTADYNFLVYRTQTLVNFITMSIIGIILFVIYFLDIKADLIDFRNESKTTTPLFFKLFLIYYIIIISSGILVSVISSATGITVVSENQETIDGILNSGMTNFLFLAFTVMLIGPIIEELVFRKGIFDLIKNKNIAFVVSGTLFGFIHVMSYIGENLPMHLIASITYMASGFALAYSYIKTNKNITTCFIIHIFHNTLSMVIFLIYQ